MSDTKNLYFYVKTVTNISARSTSSSWMQLYLNVDRRNSETGKETGWNGYDFVINYYAKDDTTTTVAKHVGADGDNTFSTAGDVSYRVVGNEMMIAVPLSMLGIDDYKEINLEFKWVDSDSFYEEAEDFYCDGDVAPLGRLNYVYQNYIPDVSKVEIETETEFATQTESVTDFVIDTETDLVTESAAEIDTTIERETEVNTETDDSEAGCKSVFGVAIMPLAVVLGGTAVICHKRKD